MKVLLQRVKEATVYIDDFAVGHIGQGLLLFVGFCKKDTIRNVDTMIDKLVKFRVFHDTHGKMNLSIQDTPGDILVVSQFTLCASTKKGTRPSFDNALSFNKAQKLYDYLIVKLREKLSDKNIETGKFGAYMQVHLINDGPATFLLEV